MSQQPEALFIADELQAPLGTVISSEVSRRAAAELRRLYEENNQLLKKRINDLKADGSLLHEALCFLHDADLLAGHNDEITEWRDALAPFMDVLRERLKLILKESLTVDSDHSEDTLDMGIEDLPLPQGYELHELPPDYDGPVWIEGQLRQFADLVAAAEREACAQRAEGYAYMSDNFNALAEEIRAMGAK